MTDGQPAQPILDTQLAGPGPGYQAPDRAFSVGGLFSRTMRIWWRHVVPFTLMSIGAYVPMLAGFALGFGWMAPTSGGPPTPPEPEAVWQLIAGAFGGGLLTMVLSIVVMGAITYGTFRSLRGERATLGEMLGIGFRRGLPVVGTGFVVWIMIMLGSLLLLVPGIIVAVATCVAVPAAVVERVGVFSAITRSFEITEGRRWPLFAAGFAILVVVWVLGALAQAGGMAAAGLLLDAERAAIGALVVSLLGNAAFYAIPSVALAVAYHDLRVEKEGVDTAALAKVFE